MVTLTQASVRSTNQKRNELSDGSAEREETTNRSSWSSWKKRWKWWKWRKSWAPVSVQLSSHSLGGRKTKTRTQKLVWEKSENWPRFGLNWTWNELSWVELNWTLNWLGWRLNFSGLNFELNWTLNVVRLNIELYQPWRDHCTKSAELFFSAALTVLLQSSHPKKKRNNRPAQVFIPNGKNGK